MATYDQEQVDDAVRRTLTPSEWVSYLAVGDDYTTPEIILNTPTGIKIPTTQLYVLDWELFDLGGGDFVVRYIGNRTNARFKATMNTGIQANINSVITNLRVHKNDEATPLPGLGIPRKIGVGTDTGAMGISGEFEVSTNDYVRFFVTLDKTATLTFIETSIVIKEVN